MLVLLATLAHGPALAQDVSAAPAPLADVDHDYQGRRLQQARDLRTAGTAMSVLGPVAGAGGIALFATAALNSRDESLVIAGIGLFVLGAAATVVGPPVLLRAGYLAADVAEVARLTPVDRALGQASAGLMIGTVAAGFLVLSETSVVVFVVPGLYAASVITGALFAHKAIRAGEGRGFAVSPSWTPRQGAEPARYGLVVTGRF